MSRKDYQAIADELNRSFREPDNAWPTKLAWEVTTAVGNALQKRSNETGGSFDRAKFDAACVKGL